MADLEACVEDTPRPLPTREIAPASKLIWRLPLSDPVTAMHLGPEGLTIGTIFGRTICLLFPEPTDGKIRHFDDFPFNRCLHAMCCAYAEDAVHMVYLKGDHVTALIGADLIFEWDLSNRKHLGALVEVEDAHRLDNRISGSMKFIVAKSGYVLVASMTLSVVYRCEDRKEIMTNLRIPDYDIVPMDMDHDKVLTFIHSADTPTLKILKLPIDDENALDNRLFPECVFQQDLPGVTGLAQAKFWGNERIVFVVNGRHIYVVDYLIGVELFHWTGTRYDVCAMDASNPARLLTISEDSVLKVWSETTGGCVSTISLAPSRFSMGNPYLLTSLGNLVVFSCDEEVSAIVL